MASQQEKANTDFIEFDFSGWVMWDVEEFQKAARQSQEENTFVPLWERMAKVTKAWTYPGDPSTVEAYGNLKPDQWKAVSKAFNESLAATFR